MLRRLFSLLLLWTPAVAILSTLACTTRMTRYILSTTVSNVLFFLDLFYLSLVASIALVIHTGFIPLQLAQPAPRITSSFIPPSNLQIEEPRPEDEDQPHSPFSSLSRIPRRSKSQSASIIPRRPPPPPPSSPSHHTHNCLLQPQPILTTSTSQKSSPPAQHHRVRFTSLPSSIAQDPRSRVASPLASQLIKTEEAFFLSGSGSGNEGSGGGVGNGNEMEARRRVGGGGKGKEREREEREDKPMTPPSSPEISLLGELGSEEGGGLSGEGGVVGGSGAKRRRKAAVAVKSRNEDGEERGKDGLGFN